MIRPRTRRLLFGALSIGALGLAVAGVSTSAQFANPRTVFRPIPQTTVISGSSSGTIFEVVNSGTSALSSFGIVGAVPAGPLAIGVVGAGVNGAAGNVGILGYDIGPNGFGGAGYNAYPVQSTTNSSNQTIGLYGVAPNGYGVVGQTNVKNSSAATYAGIEGQDLATNVGLNDGVLGTTINGGYGVEGISGNGSLGGVHGLGTNEYGVLGESTSSDGVYGQSGSADGVYGHSSSSNGVEGFSNSGTGVYGSGNTAVNGAGYYNGIIGTANGPFPIGVWGNTKAADQGYGVYGTSTANDGYGVVGVGSNTCGCSGFNIPSGVVGQGYYGVLAIAGTSGTYPFVAMDAFGDDVFYIDDVGNVYYHGTLHTFAKTRSGNVAQTYAPSSTMSTVEDTGSGSIVNGAGIVRLDPAFADTMDGAGYEVFITPEGDSRGLYVTSKTANSFVVRESQGGRSSISFSYRIVAKLYGHSTQRVAVARTSAAFGGVEALKGPTAAALRRAGHAPAVAATSHAGAAQAAATSKRQRQPAASVQAVRMPAALQHFMQTR